MTVMMILCTSTFVVEGGSGGGGSGGIGAVIEVAMFAFVSGSSVTTYHLETQQLLCYDRSSYCYCC